MPVPGAPPKLLPTTAMVFPSLDNFTRYQRSTIAAAGEPTDTVTALHVAPALFERYISPLCDTATSTLPSDEPSIQRHQRFCGSSGNLAALHVAPSSWLITIGPFWMTA